MPNAKQKALESLSDFLEHAQEADMSLADTVGLLYANAYGLMRENAGPSAAAQWALAMAEESTQIREAETARQSGSAH